ncbi:hypothetical protein Barb6_03190 [Bacteroidales bacterium Barb6]|nr:hypothetical protein Barb6_03190 [Bacteroidales bacterium Barb6]
MTENSKNMQEIEQSRIVIASQWERHTQTVTGILTTLADKQEQGIEWIMSEKIDI